MTEPLPITPSQTVGPYLIIGLAWEDGPYAVSEGTPGAVRIFGRVLDGAGAPVSDGLIETWQADPNGRFAHPDDLRGAVPASPCRGFARATTDAAGWYRILTVKPGRLPTGDGRTEAPHLDISVFARGLLDRLVTRLYFPDEVRANAADLVLSTVAPSRRHTLIALAEDEGLRFDIRLQGEHETVFFDL